MTLGALLESLNRSAWAASALAATSPTALGRTVKSIAYDSRKATAGSVFVGMRGQHADGSQFASQAAARGAIAVVSEADPPPGFQIPWLRVGDARLALAALAAAFFGNPSRELTVVGITGTNGKTTTAYVLSTLLEIAGVRCGLLGTVVYRVGAEERDAARTTPEAADVQQLLREMVDRGCGACAMEVSSHALALRRVEEIQFRAAVFTNLTRDHLDFHGDMDSYFGAKRRLFEMLGPESFGVVNVDDPRGAGLVDFAPTSITYGIDRPADVRAERFSLSIDGLSFCAHTPRGVVNVRSRLIGRPNVYNILAAVSTAIGLDVALGAIEDGLATVTGVPGRFQRVSDTSDDIAVVVDYAHTDDALKNLLETGHALGPRRLITVFGCGGDRDRSKRPLMGAVAARLSDLVIITSDNPRSEDPERIIEDIRRGIVPSGDRSRPTERNGQRTSQFRAPACLEIADRRLAINRAIELAGPGDLVLIAGKGHERYQIIGDRAFPFDDASVAEDALRKRRGG
jgi:UDP-N-acetylmuramoyl-L-alanyl-D-glutamate--2,6-diaminopimelate ligase